MPSRHIKVEYLSQNDNAPWFSDWAAGNTQCNPTTHAMLLTALLPDFEERSEKNGFAEPEAYFISKLKKYTSNRGDHDGYTRCLEKEFGIISRWRTDLKRQDLIDSINVGVPLVVGMDYSASGHILLCTGYDDNFAYFNDPYGIRRGTTDTYKEINEGLPSTVGRCDPYSWSSLRYIWLCDGGGWGRWITSIRGNLTGLK